jgi:hypothetical protein
MRLGTRAALALASIALMTASAATAGERTVAAKQPSGKTVHAHIAPTESLAQKIHGLLQQGSSQRLIAMSPLQPVRVDINVLQDAKTVTVVDTKTKAVVAQWTITSATATAEIAAISASVLKHMGFEAAPEAKGANKALTNDKKRLTALKP